MKYRKLGRTGFEVSDMAHGLWGMGGWSGSDDVSREGLQLAVDLGCNFFDTAWAYGEGKSDGAARRDLIARIRYASLRGFQDSSQESEVAGDCQV